MDSFDDIEPEFSTLDEPRATPPDVRDRIWARLTDAEVRQDSGDYLTFEPPDSEVEALELVTTATSSERDGSWWMVAAACAAFLVGAVAVLIMALPNDDPVASTEFPTNESATACAAVREATLDFDLLALDGEPLPTPAQLESINSGFARWLTVLETRDLPDAELERWQEAAQRLRQAQLDQSAGQPARAESIFDRAKDSVFSALFESDDVVVGACFGDWADNPFVGEVEVVDPDGGGS